MTRAAAKGLTDRTHQTKGGFTPEQTEQDHARFHQTTQNSAQFKTYKLLILEFFI